MLHASLPVAPTGQSLAEANPSRGHHREGSWRTGCTDVGETCALTGCWPRWRVRNTFVEDVSDDSDGGTPGSSARAESEPGRRGDAALRGACVQPAGRQPCRNAPPLGPSAQPGPQGPQGAPACWTVTAALDLLSARAEEVRGGGGGGPGGGGGASSEQRATIGGLLRSLREEGEDPDCMFIARGARSLGFQSHDLLLQHFSRFGRVARVLVAHSRVKKYHGKGRRQVGAMRLRPGNFAFIVMASAEGLERVFGEGAEQTVMGKRVSVEPFKSCTFE
ncbi:unnamed protein product [Prorocentrum cordatum]|uniref:RRM domain-containing protein n=1 Tax=Prorocentrum cordatum TaxID=2364126 RepID=A0ABN9U7F3_9DINO|nr:unnamed protein product [Polarella glacialis]